MVECGSGLNALILLPPHPPSLSLVLTEYFVDVVPVYLIQLLFLVHLTLWTVVTSIHTLYVH